MTSTLHEKLLVSDQMIGSIVHIKQTSLQLSFIIYLIAFQELIMVFYNVGWISKISNQFTGIKMTKMYSELYIKLFYEALQPHCYRLPSNEDYAFQ